MVQVLEEEAHYCEMDVYPVNMNSAHTLSQEPHTEIPSLFPWGIYSTRDTQRQTRRVLHSGVWKAEN